MNWQPINITSGHNPSRYPQVSNAQLYNFYVSEQETGPCLFPTPGYKVINKTFQDQNPRGIFYSTVFGGIIAVFDRKIYLFVNIESTPTVLNPNLPLEKEIGTVFIEENETNQVVFSDGEKIYVAIKGEKTSFEKAPIPFGIVPTNIVFTDGYFITTDKLTRKFYISGNNTALSWDTLDFSFDDSKTVGVSIANRQLLVFGEQKTGVFHDAGIVPFPFQRTATFSIEYGCLSVDSIAKGFGMICWLAGSKESDPVLMMSTGGRPKSFASENISFKISDLAKPENCDAFMYQVDGHIFYQINFYSDDISLLYDFTTQKFSEISEKNTSISTSNTNVYKMSSVQYLTRSGNKTYCLLRNKPYIHEFSNKIATNDEIQIPRSVITNNFYQNSPIEIAELRVWAQQGIYKNPDNLAYVRLSISDDSGVTFRAFTQQRIAQIGDRDAFIIYGLLGTSYRWTFKFEFFSNSPVVFMKSQIRMGVMR